MRRSGKLSTGKTFPCNRGAGERLSASVRAGWRDILSGALYGAVGEGRTHSIINPRPMGKCGAGASWWLYKVYDILMHVILSLPAYGILVFLPSCNLPFVKVFYVN